MKRILWLTLAICSLLLSSCQKDLGPTVDLLAEMEHYTSNSKVYIDTDNFACWEVGDPVNINSDINNRVSGIFNPQKNEYTIEIINNQAQISDVPINEGKSGLLSYPKGYTSAYSGRANADIECEHKNSRVIFKNLPNDPISITNKLAANLMVAYTNEAQGNLVFKNVGSIVKLNLKNIGAEPVVVNSVELIVDAGTLWANKVIVNAQDLSVTSEGDIISVSKSSLNLTIDTNETKPIFINVLPITGQGAKFTVKINNGALFNKTTKKSLVLERNKIGTLPIDLNQSGGSNPPSSDPNGWFEGKGDGSKENPFQIDGETALRLLENPIADTSYLSKHYEITSTRDLDLGIQWNGIGNDNEKFTGSFNGNKVPIRVNNSASSTSTGAIFNNCGDNAQVENVVRGLGTISPNGQQPATGGVVGKVTGNGVKITSCENRADVTIGESSSLNNLNEYNIGGVCAYVADNVSGFVLRDCKNMGSYVLASAGNSKINVGGVCGKIGASNATLVGCSNGSSIDVSGSGSNGVCAGGIVGELSTYTMDTCVNVGEIKAPIGELIYVGGLIGHSTGSGESTIWIKNSGNIGLLQCEGGGLIGYAQAMTIDNCFANGPSAKVKSSGIVHKVVIPSGSTEKIKLRNCYTAMLGQDGTGGYSYGICKNGVEDNFSIDSCVYIGKSGNLNLISGTQTVDGVNQSEVSSDVIEAMNANNVNITGYIRWKSCANNMGITNGDIIGRPILDMVFPPQSQSGD